MIVALVVGRLYVLILEKEFYIKMPKGVPPTVEKSFASIVPGIIITILMLAVRGIFGATSYGNIHKFIYTLVQIPLTQLGGGWVAFLITTLATSILWFLGVHGGMVVYSVMAPIWTTTRLQNLEAFQKGLDLPNLIPGGSFVSVYPNLGGSGATIGLAIALMFAASKRYKTLGKLTIIPGLLGINEPLMFGLPMVLNTKFIIPLIGAPLVNSVLAIIATATGIIPRLRGIGTPMGTPIIIRGFIEGGWRVAVFQAVLVAVSFLIYYPFFKKADAAALEEEAKAEVNATSVEA
jgi:PTS system cellobiose-specific IIC component